MARIQRTLAPLALALTALGCAGKPPPPPKVVEAPAPPPIVPKQVSLAEVGLDAAALDRAVDPCDDFYEFACGTWMKNTPIPADRSRWTRSFSEIDKQNDETLKEILEEAAKAQNGPDELRQKLGTFYAACMDEPGIEKAGTKPIEPLLKSIKAVKDLKTLQAALLEIQKVRISVPFHGDAEQDMKDATKYIFGISQAGLGLPDRDYYLSDDAKKVEARAAYQGHVERMLVLLGYKAPAAKDGAKAVIALETELASVSKSRVEMRDPDALYNKIDRAGVMKAAPDFPWDKYFSELGRPELKDINVTGEAFLVGMNKLFKAQKPAAWQAYLTYHVGRSLADVLPKAFADERFKLLQALTGQQELEVRWKRCVGATDDALGELLAQPYIEKRFGGDSKKATEGMVAEITAAFGAGLEKLDWMDEPTREKARAKLEKFANQIGYPSKWKAYEWAVGPSYASNVLLSRNYEFVRDLTKIGAPVDREEWGMTPPTVNAYYDAQMNKMVFPAGILQPPFYSPAASDAVNMGAMGMVVGHELTHGFDDEGSKFAGDGNLSKWWAEGTREKFEAKTQCLVDQYASYEPLPGVKLNGKLTLGENIADNGGVKLAFEAYRKMRKDAKEPLVADGFTEDQQFFLAVGQAWCTNAKDDVQRMMATVDPHSPPRFRVNGSLSNLPAFAEAFQCKPGSKMRPQNVCAVW